MNTEINYSFVIPHHNTPDLLQRLVDSIPQRGDIEIIVVDDNSDVDKKANVSRSDVKIIYIDKEHTKGAGRARNIGMDAATGKWLVFADADDFFDSKSLHEAMVEYVDADADVVVFPIRVVDSDTLQEGHWRDQWFNTLFYSKKSPKQKLMGTAACWSKFIRKDIVDRNNIRFEEIRYSNDQWFSANVAIQSDKIICDGNHKIYNLTYVAHSLTRNRGIDAFDCRFNAELRMWNLLLSHGQTTERSTYPRFLLWASNFGTSKVVETYRRLIKMNVPNTTASPWHKVKQLSFLYFVLRSVVSKKAK